MNEMFLRITECFHVNPETMTEIVRAFPSYSKRSDKNYNSSKTFLKPPGREYPLPVLGTSSLIAQRYRAKSLCDLSPVLPLGYR